MSAVDCWGTAPFDAGRPVWVEERMVQEHAGAVPTACPGRMDEWLRGTWARQPPPPSRAEADGMAAAPGGERGPIRMAALASQADGRTILDVPANASGQTRFFSAGSPWNTEVPEGAKYAPVERLGSYDVSLASWNRTYATVAVHYASADDPLVRVRHVPDSWQPVASRQWRRTGNSREIEAGILAQSNDINPYPMNIYSTQRAGLLWNNGGAPPAGQYRAWTQSKPLRVRVPAGAAPPPESDGHMVVVQPDGRALELYSPVVLGDGTLVAQQYSFTDALGGLGVGAENGRRASMIPSYAGAITDLDWRRGRIDHALALLVPASMLTTAFVWPALAFDSNPNYTGTVPMGARLALPRTLDLSSLPLRSELGRMVALAAQEYGMYVVDRGGGGITVITQHEPRSPALARQGTDEQQDLRTIFAHARLVRAQASPANAKGRRPGDARHDDRR